MSVTDMPLTPRAILHHRIRRIFAKVMAEYYRKNPTVTNNDALAEEVNAASYKIMEAILEAIDEFEISDKVPLESEVEALNTDILKPKE